MSKNTALVLVLIFLTASSITIIQPAKAEVENVGTSCSIFVDNIVEGQPITITVQIYPAPPSGETFSNLSLGIISPAQGISGYGPWDKKNILTDSNGVTKVTFNIPTFSGTWNVWVYFGGQYFDNNTLYYQSGHWERNFFISSAQTPTPSTPASPSPSLSPIPSTTQLPTISTGSEPPKTEPFLTLIVVAVALIAVLGAAVGLLVYFKKRKH